MPASPAAVRSNWRVVYCPSKAHKGSFQVSPGKLQAQKPKILFLCNPRTNEILLQCNDHRCRSSGRPTYNGWYLVRLKMGGTYSIEPVPNQKFKLLPMPAAVLADQE